VIPAFPNFKKLEIPDQGTINDLVSKYLPSSDHSFASLHCWDTQQQIKLSILNGNLAVILNDYLSNEKFLTFIGNNDPAGTINVLFSYLKKSPDLPFELRLITEDCFSQVNITKDYSVIEDRDYFDYIYSLEELASLSGNKFRGKRNFINRFKRQYQYSVSEIDITNDRTWQQVKAVYDLWKSRHVAQEGNADNETIAIDRLRDIVKLSDFYNLGLFVDGKLVGYTLNELNTKEYATNHFEHGNTDFIGVFPMLRHETAKKLLERGLKHLSHQEDLGLVKLRKSKTDWHPKFYLKKFTIAPLSLSK
jgi:hypothetical protein